MKRPQAVMGGDLIPAVASVGVLLQGLMAIKEPAAQNSLTGDEVSAFAMIVDEAALQGGLKGIADGMENGEPEGKKKEKQDASLCLSEVSALLMQGTYHVQQTADLHAGQTQSLPTIKEGTVEKPQALKGQAGSSEIGLKTAKAQVRTDVPVMPAAEKTDMDPVLKAQAQLQTTKMDAGNPPTGPTLRVAKGKDELDQTDSKDVQGHKALVADKAAQFVGVDPARQDVNQKPAVKEAVMEEVSRMAASEKPDRDKEKPVQMPVAAMAAARGAAHAVHAQSAQEVQAAAPDRDVREENAALQVARASIRALRRGATEYRVKLNPEGLGEVEVTVVTKGKAVALSMRTDNVAARSLILNHADELRAELTQQNYQVSGLSVEVGMDTQGGAGFFAPGEHPEHAYDAGYNAEREAAVPQDRGSQQEPRMILPRSSTISYRI